MSESVAGNESSKGSLKPGRRVITEKRREQNRRSQKAYREKQKRRLEELEGQATNTKEAVAHQSPPAAPVINLFDLFTAAGDLPLSTDANLPSWDLVIRRTPQSDKPNLSAPSSSLVPRRGGKNTTEPVRDQDHATSSLSNSTSPSGAFSAASEIPPPDSQWMYINYLRLQTENSLTAMIAIANSIGITQESYVNDEPSPFPLQAVSRTHDIDFHLATSFRHIKPDLRPSRTQLTINHPTFLDCIVFPGFRDRAILYLDTGKLDLFELFVDLMNDGLVCWGNVRHSGGSSSSSTGMENGVAWSMRSWEARPWFLKKWSFLVGDQDDEMWTGSRWWWNMRGEDVDSITELN